MKRFGNVLKVATVCLMTVCVSACSYIGGNKGESNAKKFLTSFYTTNENKRYTTFASTDSTSQEDMDAAVETYYSDFEDIVEEELLDTMKENRIPVKYDELYLDEPVQVDDVSLSRTDEKYSFVVTGRQNDEVVSYGGVIGISEDNKVNYFYEN